MNPEYISKIGYDARAGAELTRNSIQMTGNLRMDTVRPFRWTSFENMKRAQEVTAINAPAQYNRPGDSLLMIPFSLQLQVIWLIDVLDGSMLYGVCVYRKLNAADGWVHGILKSSKSLQFCCLFSTLKTRKGYWQTWKQFYRRITYVRISRSKGL